MLGYIAVCDIYGNVDRVMGSIPSELAVRVENVGQLFKQTEQQSALLEKSDGRVVSVSVCAEYAGREGQRNAYAAAKNVGDRILFLLCDIEENEQLTRLMELYLSAAAQIHADKGKPSDYDQLQKINNQLINYQRGLARANERLKQLLEETREAKSTIDVLGRDPLTNLLTQTAFFENAKKLLREKPEQDFDIVAVDIERFKIVNDAFGAPQGDELLVRMAHFLQSVPAEGEALFARARADKFYAMVRRSEEFYGILRKKMALFEETYPLPMRLQIKIGVYAVEDREMEIVRMCDRAVLAADSIKGIYDREMAFYDDSLREKMMREQKIIDTMEESLQQGNFQVFLQPKVEIGTGKLIGAEALVRWDHPEYGMISPADFIPLFEKNDFIYNLDRFMWDKTCQIIEMWKNKFGSFVPISVNVSRKDLYHGDLPDVLTKLTANYHLNPSDLHLEITESAYVADSHQLLAVIGQLKQIGFVIEMDDFGKGYSSLNTLSELPIDILKLDMEFLKPGKNIMRRREIMRLVIDLATRLKLQVIAEGVETEEQRDLLKGMGCKYAQGYLYGKPMHREAFLRYLTGIYA
ncbi:GGDEF domain-containing phosphodiesterase [Anaerovorax odorimutans]|uniref:GGDEF domain-containing phosphodiesterase n=1 Tax=Anaerovorax odorimutans TaxID=109327 RepID=A0ABT1RLC6_9FIRM|nr:GGDEF domain-containing phosphodiesterase [Anaerovorax odorimutans]MCQ4635994.1 GGDEF domain-containing phosphodiesterase [Anaerovorax odorimutans]